MIFLLMLFFAFLVLAWLVLLLLVLLFNHIIILILHQINCLSLIAMTFAISTCPCCLPATLIGGVVFSWLFLQVVGGFIFPETDSKEARSILSRIVNFITKSLGVLLILTAILLGVLETNEDLRKMLFSTFCTKMTQDSAMDVLRCGE